MKCILSFNRELLGLTLVLSQFATGFTPLYGMPVRFGTERRVEEVSGQRVLTETSRFEVYETTDNQSRVPDFSQPLATNHPSVRENVIFRSEDSRQQILSGVSQGNPLAPVELAQRLDVVAPPVSNGSNSAGQSSAGPNPHGGVPLNLGLTGTSSGNASNQDPFHAFRNPPPVTSSRLGMPTLSLPMGGGFDLQVDMAGAQAFASQITSLVNGDTRRHLNRQNQNFHHGLQETKNQVNTHLSQLRGQAQGVIQANNAAASAHQARKSEISEQGQRATDEIANSFMAQRPLEAPRLTLDPSLLARRPRRSADAPSVQSGRSEAQNQRREVQEQQNEGHSSEGSLGRENEIASIDHASEAISADLVRQFNSPAVDKIRENITDWKGAPLNDHQRAALGLIDRYGVEAGRLAELANRTDDDTYRTSQKAVVSAGFDALQELSEHAVQGGDDYGQASEVATALLDIATSMTPGVSLVKDVGEFISGHSAITGERLTSMERAFAGIGIVTLGTSNIAKGGVKALGFIAKSAKGLGLAGRGIKSSARVVSRVVDSARQSWTSVKGLLHTVKGNAKLAVDGTFKLKSGMHTDKGLEHFVRLNAGKGKNYTMQAVTSFGEKNLTSGVILKETLPNGVTRLQLPRDAWHNSDAFKSAAIEILPGQKVKGIKTLWPSNFSVSDIADVTETVFQAGKTGVLRERISGTFRNLKITVNVDGGKVVSSFPDWIQ